MPIPDFDPDGLLPYGAFAGPHWVFPEPGGEGVAVDTYSVVERPTGTATRHALYAELDRYADSVTARVPCALFLVSGEFVTDEVDPLDIHIGVILLHDAMAELEQRDLWELNRMLDDREAKFGDKIKCRVTLQLARVFPPDHSRYPETLDQLARLRHVCAEPVPGGHGGYVQFTLCDEGGEPHEILSFLANAVAATQVD
jgi:hypothetical protein